ncbi:hypothetical protein [Micromonospora sp. LH3U1]|uniref:hypothetical protein n=1 Tax=Micromonospora sp. LH3U1 TaxID=3018339 RepID=UPI002349297B|nr:hypothetical protein [Micromonospora sp. LH3U1]WCN84853.1 hypothetical protein PCA76_14510 [Micromonospora sp. LH3U1]
MSRRGAVRVTASVLVTALLVGGCGTPRSGALGPAPTAVPSSAAPPSPTSSGPAPTERADPTPPADPPRSPTTTSPAPASTTTRDTVAIELWFVRAGQIVPTRRARPATVATSRLALTELAADPRRPRPPPG